MWTLGSNTILDHSDVVEDVGAAPITSSFLTHALASMVWVKTTARWEGIWCDLYYRFNGLFFSVLWNVFTNVLPIVIADFLDRFDSLCLRHFCTYIKPNASLANLSCRKGPRSTPKTTYHKWSHWANPEIVIFKIISTTSIFWNT